MFDANFVYVKPLLHNLSADVSSKDKRKVAELIIRNADVFSKHECDLGVIFITFYHIDTGNDPPNEGFRGHTRYVPKIEFWLKGKNSLHMTSHLYIPSFIRNS